jgi:hypothetical protein
MERISSKRALQLIQETREYWIDLDLESVLKYGYELCPMCEDAKCCGDCLVKLFLGGSRCSIVLNGVEIMCDKKPVFDLLEEMEKWVLVGVFWSFLYNFSRCFGGRFLV